MDWVDDGHEALWLAENYHFDLIVLDIMLPERDGSVSYGSSGEAETRCLFCSSPRVVMYKIAPLV